MIKKDIFLFYQILFNDVKDSANEVLIKFKDISERTVEYRNFRTRLLRNHGYYFL